MRLSYNKPENNQLEAMLPHIELLEDSVQVNALGKLPEFTDTIATRPTLEHLFLHETEKVWNQIQSPEQRYPISGREKGNCRNVNRQFWISGRKPLFKFLTMSEFSGLWFFRSPKSSLPFSLPGHGGLLCSNLTSFCKICFICPIYGSHHLRVSFSGFNRKFYEFFRKYSFSDIDKKIFL